MVAPLLVFTLDVAFGELIARSLEETGRFSLRVLSQVDEVVAYVRKEKCSLTFLDLDISDPLRAGRALLQANAEMRFVFLSGVNPDPALDELNPRAHLTKPFYLPDLLEMMDKLFSPLQSGTPRRTPQDAPSAPPVADLEMVWQADVNRAAQHLTRLTLESSAQAALINRDNELWAYAGQLPQAAAHELARMVARYWDQNEESDLVRFVRLNSTNAEHMLFATRLAAGLVLRSHSMLRHLSAPSVPRLAGWSIPSRSPSRWGGRQAMALRWMSLRPRRWRMRGWIRRHRCSRRNPARRLLGFTPNQFQRRPRKRLWSRRPNSSLASRKRLLKRRQVLLMRRLKPSRAFPLRRGGTSSWSRSLPRSTT